MQKIEYKTEMPTLEEICIAVPEILYDKLFVSILDLLYGKLHLLLRIIQMLHDFVNVFGIIRQVNEQQQVI